jgi:uncharacterized membrane protein YGL010W
MYDMSNLAFASVNIIGAVMIAVLMMETTPEASIRRAWIDPQAMWGMMRRLFYCSMAGGLAGMALGVYAKWFVLTPAEMVLWLMVVVPIGLFLIIRALQFVDQDRWVGFGGWQRRRMANAHALYEQEKAPGSL